MGNLGGWDDRQAGPCMGRCMGGAWVLGDGKLPNSSNSSNIKASTQLFVIQSSD